jgi:lipopolysaccharide export system permease protein
MSLRSIYRRILPSRIDQYLLTEVIGPFMGATVFLLFVFMMFQALRLADFFINRGVGGMMLGKLSALMALSFLPMALPPAFLMAMLMAYGRLSSDSELVAMKASGMSLIRLALPPLFLSILMIGVSLVLNSEWVPWGAREFKSTLIKVSNTKVVGTIKQGTFTGFFDLLIFAEKVDTKTNRLEKVFIFDEREAKNPLTVVAQSGELVQVKTGNALGMAAMLKLYDGSIHHNDLAGNTYQKIDFGEYSLYLKVDEGTAETQMKPHMYTHRELLRWIAQAKPGNYDWAESRGEYWRRIATACSFVLFVFLGIGFGTVRTRAVRAGAALTSIVVLLLYWGTQTTASAMMQKGILPPWLAMQVPNIVIGILGLVSFRRASW